MKKNVFILALGIGFTASAQAGIFDGIKNFFSSEEKEETHAIEQTIEHNVQDANIQTKALTTDSTIEEDAQQLKHNVEQQLNTSASNQLKSGIVNQVSSSLGVTEQQAAGGLGALFSQAQSNLTADEFSSLSNHVPNISTLLAAAPAVADIAGSQLGGLVGGDTLQKTTESISSASTLVSQFNALGLDKGMIPQFIDLAMGFLKQKGGNEASALLQTALGSMG